MNKMKLNNGVNIKFFENSRDAAINFMSASARFTKKPFLRQVDIAKRMAREKVLIFS